MHFLWVKLETEANHDLRAYEVILHTFCKQWTKKAVEYYFKALLQGGEAMIGKKQLMDIVYWAATTSSQKHPSLLKVVCKVIGEKPPCKATSQAYLMLVDLMIKWAVVLLGEFKESNASIDCIDRLRSWKDEHEERLERFQIFAPFLEMPDVFTSRQDLSELLLDFVRFHASSYGSFNYSSFIDFQVVLSRVVDVHLSYSQALNDASEEHASTYKDTGTLFFLWAKCMLWEIPFRKDENPLRSCKQWAVKALLYCYKAMLKGYASANKVLLDIVYWAARNYASFRRQPSLLQVVFYSIDAMLLCKVSCYAYLIRVDIMMKQGITLLRKRHKEKHCKCSSDFQSWMAECEEALERLYRLSSFLDNPEVFVIRKDLFQHLVNCVMLRFPLSLSHYSPSFAALIGAANAHLRYSLRPLDVHPIIPSIEHENAYNYKYIGKAFFYLARYELRVSHNKHGKLQRSEEVLNCFKVQMSKVLHYYYKAMSVESSQMMSNYVYYREIQIRNLRMIIPEEETKRLFFAIVDWAAHSLSPTLLKIVCKSIEDEEGQHLVLYRNTYLHHLVVFSYAYLKLVDVLLYLGIVFLEEYMQRFDAEGVRDYSGLLMECEKTLERLKILNGSLQKPHDLMGRQHLLSHLISTVHSNTKHKAMKKLATLMRNNEEIKTLGANLNPRAMKTLVTLMRKHQERARLEEKREHEEEIEREFVRKVKERRKWEKKKAKREILMKLEEKRRLEEKAEREILINFENKRRILKMEADKSVESYLRFLYKEHPHPNPNRNLGSISNPVETKEALRMAIQHYHPDGNIKHGREWAMLCNEVTKFLNNKYMNYT